MCCVAKITGFFFLIQASFQEYVSPDTESYHDLTLLPKMKRCRIKPGSSISLSCNKAKNDVAWQFKSCGMNYKGMNCDSDNGEIDTNQASSWRSLHEHNGNRTLRIENASLEDFGIYRCISGNFIRKIFIVEMNAAIFKWPPPKVISVIPNDEKIHINSHLTINCSVSSRTPPKILWFKVCWTDTCDLDFTAYDIDIEENFNCLCLINNTSNSTYNWENLYVSKLHVFNTHVWDGGSYVCSALSSDGKDFKKVTVNVEYKGHYYRNGIKSYLTLLFIPLIFILLYILSHICCATKRKSYNNEPLTFLMSKTHVISVN